MLPIIIAAIIVIAGVVVYLLWKSGDPTSTGYVPIVCIPDDPSQAYADNVMHWTITGDAGKTDDTLVIDGSPPGSFAAIPQPIPVKAGDGTGQQNPIKFTVQLSHAPPSNTITVRGTTAGGAASGTVQVQPVPVSLTPGSPSAPPGANVDWTIKLNQPAPPGDQVVNLSSTTPADFSALPLSVLVLGGQLTATFPTTLSNVAVGTAFITAECHGISVIGDVLIT